MMLTKDEQREIRNDILKGLQKPHIWRTTPIVKDEISMKIHVQDLKEKKYGKALTFLQEHFLTSEYLCKTVDINSSQIDTSHLLHLMLTWLRDGASLEAVAEIDPDEDEMPSETERKATARVGWHEESEHEMIGLLVCRVAFKLEHSRTYSRFRIPGIGCEEPICKVKYKKKISLTPSEIADVSDGVDAERKVVETPEEEETQLSEILKFRSDLELLTDVYEYYNVNEYLRIYVICISPDWQDMNIEEDLFNAAIEQAKLMKLTVAMTMCTSPKEKLMVQRFGMNELAHLNYKQWDEKSIISNKSKENSQAVIMTKVLMVESDSEDEIEILSIKQE